MTLRALALCAAAVLSGCYKTTFTTGAATSAAPKQEIWHHRIIGGIVELPSPVDLGRVCPSGVARIHTEISPLNALVQYAPSVIGLPSLYNPSTIQVWCKSGTAARISSTEDGVVDISYLLEDDASLGL